MTQNELINLPHIEKTRVLLGRILGLKAEEGYEITKYEDSEPITAFFSSRYLPVPLKDEYTEPYRIITAEEANAYREKRRSTPLEVGSKSGAKPTDVLRQNQ